MANKTINSRFVGGIITAGGIYAASTTEYGPPAAGANSSSMTKGTAATQLPTGVITASVGIVSNGGLSAAGTFRAGGGVGFQAGNYKKFAAGTYIGTGGATAAITSTGLTTVHGVWMTRYKMNNSSQATTANVLCVPMLAASTTSSFYPNAFKLTGTGAITALNTVAATFKWFAVGL